MRRWLAVLIGTAAIAGASTALALGGYSESGDEVATETTVKVEETTTTEKSPLELEAIPEGLLVEDELPEPKPVEEEPDDTPPEIVILNPEDGQVFERKEVAFEGETEPGARVFAGDYEAVVTDAGAWRIVLFLSPGESAVTIKAIDSSGNVGADTVTVVYEKPHVEEPKAEEPKEEKPKEEPKEWEFLAHQAYGECAENPPYDVFYGKGRPGTLIHIESEYGGGVAEVGEKGGWEKKVVFEEAPLGEVFAVHVTDEFGNHKVFEFVHTD